MGKLCRWGNGKEQTQAETGKSVCFHEDSQGLVPSKSLKCAPQLWSKLGGCQPHYGVGTPAPQGQAWKEHAETSPSGDCWIYLPGKAGTQEWIPALDNKKCIFKKLLVSSSGVKDVELHSKCSLWNARAIDHLLSQTIFNILSFFKKNLNSSTSHCHLMIYFTITTIELIF